ncbi:MAG TPA: YetF domain-containing protein [Thermoanaerobaculia bacterium]|nr:YetF domain-containing protein [Thermoanaerobaculia bacterium]
MDLSQMLFGGWTPILRTLLVGTLSYAALVLTLRASGKRTLAKLNAFDLVVTVALGSTLATVLLSKDVALAQGVVAFLTLIGLQYAVAYASVRSIRIARLVRSEPTLLVRRGEVLPDAMRHARVTQAELRSVIRSSSHPDPESVAAVILESDGSFSVIGAENAGDWAERSVDDEACRRALDNGGPSPPG